MQNIAIDKPKEKQNKPLYAFDALHSKNDFLNVYFMKNMPFKLLWPIYTWWKRHFVNTNIEENWLC